MFWLVKEYQFLCDDCPKMEKFPNIKFARNEGWAVSKDKKKCYCNKCAPRHRNVGRKGI